MNVRIFYSPLFEGWLYERDGKSVGTFPSFATAWDASRPLRDETVVVIPHARVPALPPPTPVVAILADPDALEAL